MTQNPIQLWHDLLRARNPSGLERLLAGARATHVFLKERA